MILLKPLKKLQFGANIPLTDQFVLKADLMTTEQAGKEMSIHLV